MPDKRCCECAFLCTVRHDVHISQNSLRNVVDFVYCLKRLQNMKTYLHLDLKDKWKDGNRPACEDFRPRKYWIDNAYWNEKREQEARVEA